LDVSKPHGFAEAVLGQGATLADLHGMTKEELNGVHALACAELREARPEAALELLGQLVRFAPDDRRYLVAYAMALQQVRQYESAAKFYGYALLVEATDALCALRIGECLAAQAQWAPARDAFEAALKLSWLDPRHEPVRASAERRLDQLVRLGF
jgi:tetratricopeptide (TPR) repeat protein